MGLILISMLLTIFLISLFIWKWTLYSTVLLGNLTITAIVFKFYSLANGHGAVMVYLFFLLKILVLHLCSIPFFIFKRKSLYFIIPSVLFIFEITTHFNMNNYSNKIIIIDLLLFLSFFPLHILFYIKNREKW